MAGPLLILAVMLGLQPSPVRGAPLAPDRDAACSREGCPAPELDQSTLLQVQHRQGVAGAAAKANHLDPIVARMKTLAPDAEGKLWKFSDGNLISPNVDDWLLQSPNCWADNATTKKCSNSEGNVPGAQKLADSIERDIASATQWVDVTTLADTSTIKTEFENIKPWEWKKPEVIIFRLDFATGIFHKAIAKGIRAAYSKAPNVTFRLLAGFPTGNLPSVFVSVGDDIIDGVFAKLGRRRALATLMANAAEWYDKKLRKEIGGDAGKNAKITVAYVFTTFGTSWNHAKIVAVDGKSIIEGGHNLWDEDYNGAHPVTDMSMRLEGPAASMGHRMANLLWDFACDSSGCQRSKVNTDMFPNHSITECPRAYVPAEYLPGAGTARVLAVGEMGVGMRWFDSIAGAPEPSYDTAADCSGASEINTCQRFDVDNPGMEARRMLVDGAKKSVFFSQQDLIFDPTDACISEVSSLASIFDPGFYDARLFMSIARKLKEAVSVTIVISTPMEAAAAMKAQSGYSVSKNLTQISTALLHKLDELGMNDTDAKQVLCQHLNLASIRIAPGFKTWPLDQDAPSNNRRRHAEESNNKNAPKPFPMELHTKLLSVDDEAFYIGSHNAYPTTLQEFGNIVEDTEASKQLKVAFLDKLWLYSKETKLNLCTHPN